LRVWVNAEYLLWWIHSGPLRTPLVTTGSLADIPPGALGQPGTRVLFGDRPMDYGALSGVRLGGGVELAENVALEGNYFILTNGAVHFRAASDANGNPLITRPFFSNQIGLQDALGVAVPGFFLGPYAGSTTIAAHSRLQGFEINLASGPEPCGNMRFCGLVGFRFLHLNEDLAITDNLLPLAPGVLTFLGAPVGPPSTLADSDQFNTRNTFYGGQVGGRLQWGNETVSVGLLGKVGLGATHQTVIINGSSTLFTPGVPPAVASGGVLALPTNIGHYSRDRFSVIPEVGVKLGWNITPRLTASVGYTFLYWTDVARPGNQIDPNLNATFMPTNQGFGNGRGTNSPTFTFHESNFWAQGIEFGLEFKF
jgi:hypothetical protein